MSSNRSFLAAVVTSLVACSSPTDNQDPRACAQVGGEFGNYGCVEVSGSVVGADQSPLRQIMVNAVFLPGRGVFNTSFDETDLDGRFTVRVYRFLRPETTPDTISFYVRAVNPPWASMGAPGALRDSVLVTATVTPVGRIPVPTMVTISLVAK